MSQITILNQANVPMGPFTREQVGEKLQSGEVTMSSLAFVEGLSQWTPLRDVLARVDAASPPVIRPTALPVAASVATPFATAPAPVVASPAYSYAATMAPPAHLAYAGFWLRFAAYLVDRLIVGIPLGIIGFITGLVVGIAHPSGSPPLTDASGEINVSFIIMEVCLLVLGLLAYWLYFALQESSSAQATLGKRILGLKVTDLAGRRIGFGQASGRFFGKIISAMTIYIGFIMAGFTDRKQALHDMIAGTLVVRG